MNLPDSAKTVLWCGDSICVGYKKEYQIVHIRSGQISELFPTGKSEKPLSISLPNQQMLLVRDCMSLKFSKFDLSEFSSF